MIDLFKSFIPQTLILLLGGIIVAVLTATKLPETPRKLWRAAAGSAILAVIANGLLLSRSGWQFGNLLTRDIVAWILLAGGTPLVIAVVALAVAGETDQVSLRTLAAFLVLLALAAILPLILLLVHCTSGDCL